MEWDASTVLDTAYEAGVRYFDAARSYGKAEAFLASWLEHRALPPAAVTVGSKWGYTYTAGWRVDAERHEVKDLSVTTLRRQLAESRDLLGPHLSLYQIHSATIESGVLDDRAVHEELRQLQETGLAIGLTSPGLTRPKRSSAPSRSGSSTRFRRPGTCSSVPWGRCWRKPMRPGSA